MVMIRSMSADGREALPSARLLSSNLLSSPPNPTTLTVNVMQVQLETGQQSLFAISVDFVANNDLYGHKKFSVGPVLSTRHDCHAFGWWKTQVGWK